MTKKSQWQIDREEDNSNRADCINAALTTYRQAKDGVRDSDEADFSDMLCDMMHHARAYGVDFDTELDRARMNYNDEI